MLANYLHGQRQLYEAFEGVFDSCVLSDHQNVGGDLSMPVILHSSEKSLLSTSVLDHYEVVLVGQI